MPWRASAARAAPGLREPAGRPREDPGIVLDEHPQQVSCKIAAVAPLKETRCQLGREERTQMLVQLAGERRPFSGRAAVTRPTRAHISGRSPAWQAGGLRSTVTTNRSEPMTSGNAQRKAAHAAGDGAPPLLQLRLIPQMSGASDRSRNQRFRRSKGV
jgi:hypothetical protein